MAKDKKSAADIDNSELERIEKERKKKREESLKKLKAKLLNFAHYSMAS